MQAINPSYPRLARLITVGELRKRTSSSVACGRSWSLLRNTTMLAASEKIRQTAATIEVLRRWVIQDQSFEIAVLKDQNGSAQSHDGVKQRIKSVMHDELARHWLLMSDGTDHIKCRKIWHKISRPSC